MTRSFILMPTINRSALAGLTILAALLVSACEKADQAQIPAEIESISIVNQAAENIQVKVDVDHNYLSEGCPNNAESCYRATMTLKLPNNMPNNWRMNFPDFARHF
jgi:hexosaminidase